MAITCKPIATGKVGRRYLCTDGTKSWLAGPEYKYEGKLAREVYPHLSLDTKPTDGVILHGGWGGNQDANNWRIVNMRDKPELFKVVDDTGKNIITDFKTELDAQKYIDYHLFGKGGTTTEEPGTGTPEPPSPPAVEPTPPSPGPTTPPSPPAPSTGGIVGPYPNIGEEMKHSIRGPTTRHYASGKPDDETIEANVKNIKARNHQFIVDVTMHEIEHSDTLSLKFGGTHMGTGWFDNTIDFGTDSAGLVALGTEKKHPSADLRIVKGNKIGNILEKRVRVAGVYRADENKVEMWTDFEGSGWKKQVEGTDVGGFNPKANTFEAQLRIDGFKKGSVPTIHTAVVQPIA